MTINLMIVPGQGLVEATFPDSQTVTVADIVSQYNLFGRNLIVNGESIHSDNYQRTTLNLGDEVWATGAVKGA